MEEKLKRLMEEAQTEFEEMRTRNIEEQDMVSRRGSWEERSEARPREGDKKQLDEEPEPRRVEDEKQSQSREEWRTRSSISRGRRGAKMRKMRSRLRNRRS